MIQWGPAFIHQKRYRPSRFRSRRSVNLGFRRTFGLIPRPFVYPYVRFNFAMGSFWIFSSHIIFYRNRRFICRPYMLLMFTSNSPLLIFSPTRIPFAIFPPIPSTYSSILQNQYLSQLVFLVLLSIVRISIALLSIVAFLPHMYPQFPYGNLYRVLRSYWIPSLLLLLFFSASMRKQ